MTPVSERRGYIGGSDWYELLSGCQLRLWKIKRGGDEGEKTGAMRRGTILEPLIAEEYHRITKRDIRRENKLLRHKLYRWPCAHIDRWTWNESDLRGVLECKSANPFAFRTFVREGLPDHYIAQMQWYLYVTGCSWGAYAILEPNDWQFHSFDVERDDELLQILHDKASTFWGLVENGPAPDKLEANAKPCRKCQFRDECHPFEPLTEDLGEAVRDDELEPLAAKLAEARRIGREAKQWEEECAEALTEALGERRNVVAGELAITRQTIARKGYTVEPTNFVVVRVKERK